MRFDQRLNLEQQQTLHLTTELRQGLTVLQLDASDLADYVNLCIEDNPVLVDGMRADDATSPAARRADETASDAPHEKVSLSTADANRTVYSGIGSRSARLSTDALLEGRGHGSPETFDAERRDMSQRSFSIDRFLEAPESLTEHVMSQLRMQAANDRTLGIAGFIMGSLDQSGYLATPVDEMAAALCIDADEIEAVLGRIQHLQPLGIAARNLAECLRPQLESAGLMTPLMDDLLCKHLPDLEKKSAERVARDMGVASAELESALRDIRTCNPRPGLQFSSSVNPIWPEAVIERAPDGAYTVRLNDLYLPELKVDEHYRTLAATSRDKATGDYLKTKIKEAEGLIEGIAYRNATLYKTACCIAEMQTEFFDEGFERLRPLTMAQVAQAIGVSQSTISRIANGNYVQTPRGTFELRFFFHGSAQASNAVEVSTISVKKHIQQLVEAENPTQPLSDQAIADKLAGDGIDISRRTVAKYRTQLGIPVRAARKRV